MTGSPAQPRDFSVVTRRFDHSFASVCGVLTRIPPAAGSLRFDLPLEALTPAAFKKTLG